MVLALFAVFLVGGVFFEHFYCPGRCPSCADGTAAVAELDHTMTWSLELGMAGGMSHSLRYFSDYYCCCVHDFSKNHAGCKSKTKPAKSLARQKGRANLLE